MTYRILGGPFGTAQFIMAVTFSRVYFHCHFIGDTIVGMMIGVFVGTILSNIGLKSALKTFYLAVFGVNDDIYTDF